MKAFCIGNGESRKGFDLEQLRPHGKIYGCNGLYRDFTPDVLCSVDGPMMHEIYQSGYCDNNETWFRDWNAIPGMTYDMVVYANLTPEQIAALNKRTKLVRTKLNFYRGDQDSIVVDYINYSVFI